MLALEVLVRVGRKDQNDAPVAYLEQRFAVEGDAGVLLSLVATNQKTGEAVRAMAHDLIAQVSGNEHPAG